ncbi:hypothetical protein [Brunnivagina elsteri]|uniref:Uncharacterized protein n=1 Tax=Brunnivagina elsteri CCALA 953 TaxID=987040 RepID=A0A2A2TGU2_9CYAN|nr:hypothetical protein [Calothrix elsteri]PAX52639.1 hypothetical protein CK510_18240 [Calothrix elsteri CCALA 953]
MNLQLTPNEINTVHELLKDYTPADKAVDAIARHKGNLESSFEELWINKNGETPTAPKKSLWQTTSDVLREELCGDDGFRARLSEYTKSPENAVLLTAVIGYVLASTGLPIDPSIATIFVLYILKIGLNIYCEYTEQEISELANPS